MEVWQFIQSTFKRTNKNWILIIVEFVSGIIMVALILIGIAIPALIMVVPAFLGDVETEEFLPYIAENVVLVLLGVLIFLIFLLAGLWLWAFITGGVRSMLLDSILKEKQFEFKTFIKYCKKFVGRIIGLWSIIGLIYCGIFVILGGIAGVLVFFSIGMYESSEAGALLLGIFGGGLIFLVLLIIGFLFGVFAAIANTYLIVEDAQVGDSLRGSLRFIKAHPGHTFLVVFLLMGIGFVVGMAFAILTMPIRVIPYIGAMFSLILSPIQMALNLYISLFGAVAYLLFYLWKQKRLGSDFQTVIAPE
ncbi:MAG: hypothetical protein E3J78_04870 [Candidatus Cloacimonadota bacterium]|jgi:hypothetical protein|nr:MAG: hypothetical protein E3J78_04870 [Candidatus Cloacimonadota bacterium]